MQIAIVADKGGVGKSLLAAHLAARYAQTGWETTLIDLDRRLESSRHLDRAHAPVTLVRVGEGAHLDAPTDKQMYVWDTPAHPDRAITAGLAEHDLVVVVTDPEVGGLLAAKDLYQTLTALGGRSRVLINNVPPVTNQQQLRDTVRALGAMPLESVVRRYACYGHARGDGRLVCDYPYAKADEAWSDIARLADELMEMTRG